MQELINIFHILQTRNFDTEICESFKIESKPLDITVVSETSNKNIACEEEDSFYPSASDTPRKISLKRKIFELKNIDQLWLKKIRKLQHLNWRQKKRLKNLQDLVKTLQNRNLLCDEDGAIITQNFGNNTELFRRLLLKNKSKSVPRKYSQNLRSFALTLNFFSPKAYNYVRDRFLCSLPHPKTLSKWYSTIDGSPGFCSEALSMLRLKVKKSIKPVVCSLVFDEMAIREHLEWDGKKYCGLVDFGGVVDDMQVGNATQALVFMLVCINEAWKVPVGYFFINSLTSTQKTELLKQCVHAVSDCSIIISNITFDGAAVNFSVLKQLNCNTDIKTLNTEVNICTSEFVFPDPSHMIKLVRNLFGEILSLLDVDGNEINFKYLVELNKLQENEGLHLANRLRKKHILFFKQKMKTKLATQLLSRSVADSLLFCKNVLKLETFANCGATVKFIIMMNDAFDILNSRKITATGYKKAMCKDNICTIKQFYSDFCTYIFGLKDKDGGLIITSRRKTGPLGLVMALKSAICLYDTYIGCDTPILEYIPLHKLGQDHLELFFGNLRDHGGHNDNPTARQFTAAYKKLLIHSEIKNNGVGNCIPLEDINILNCSSGKKVSAADLINERNIIYNER